MEDLVTIVVPVYNAEAYISKCIESILKQSYKNIELLLVNDGSTDDSENICRKYAREDNRIKIFSKPNAGVSSARNKGIEKACKHPDHGHIQSQKTFGRDDIDQQQGHERCRKRH